MIDIIEARRCADRFVAAWNEPDAAARSALIRDVWAEGGYHLLVDPAQGVRDAAARLAMPTPMLEARGYTALEARIGRAYDLFLAGGEHVFRAAGEPVPLSSRALGVRWSMVSTRTGEIVGGGMDVLALDEGGKVRADHQFIDV